MNNKNLEREIIKYLSENNKCPSEFAKEFNNFLHSDIEITRWSVTNICLKIEKKLEELCEKGIINRDKLSKKFQQKNKEVFFFSTYPSFIAFSLNLAVIYNFFNIKCNIYFTTEENPEKVMNDDYKKIFLNEINFFKKNFKSINLENINNLKTQKILPNVIKEQIKLLSAIDVMFLKQTFLLKKNEKYKEYSKKIVNKFNLKHRYITNLSGAKKIANYIHKNQHWIIHNSNGGLPGSVQKIINANESTYCSFEYEEENRGLREFKIGQSTNSEILEHNTTAIAKDYINSNLNNELCIEYGKKKLISLYEKNYSKDEVNNFYKKYPELKNFDKKKIFLFLSNSLVDSRFYNHSSHTIFDNIDEFLVNLSTFFKNTDLKLILRYHPADVEQGTNFIDNMEQILKKVSNSKNIYFCDDRSISSYSLSGITNNIIVYASDIGAEMIALKKNVITCAKAIYKDFNLTYFPTSQDDFFKKIIFLTNNNFSTSENDIKKAYLYKDFFDNFLFKNFFMKIGDSSNQIIENFNDVRDELIKSTEEKSSVLLDFL